MKIVTLDSSPASDTLQKVEKTYRSNWSTMKIVTLDSSTALHTVQKVEKKTTEVTDLPWKS
jgi:hypothetical protein